MCACFDEEDKKFGLQSKGEQPILFTIENFETKTVDSETRMSFTSAPYGVNVERGGCDVQIIESKDFKYFLINFSLRHYGYIVQSKNYAKDTAFRINVPVTKYTMDHNE